MLTLDTLTLKEREFYERARLKLAFSLMFAAFGMMLLGFCSTSGGISAAINYFTDSFIYKTFSVSPLGGPLNDKAAQDQISGYGFAAFAYILGSLISFTVALYISPLVSSQKEKYALREPRGLVDLYRERASMSTIDRPSMVA